MPRDPKHDVLFDPVRIGPKTLRNRFYQVPHCTGYGSEKPRSQAAHRAMKAEGGWAAVCTEYAPIDFDSDESPYVSAALLDEADLGNLALIADAVHEHGALAGIELTHVRGHAGRRESRWPAIAPSQLASDYEPSTVAKAMERDDIRRVRAAWVRAARDARSVGFDIVYVYGGHSYLATQFLSPFYNRRTDEYGGYRRTDEYGGSLENRARWGIQLEKLRNVELLTGVSLTTQEVRQDGAEVVVVATGARWAADGLSAATHAPIPGADASRPDVLTPEQVMLEGKCPQGERVVVYDGEGYVTAAGVAELLAGEGYRVELVTLLEQVAQLCDETLEGPLVRRRLHDLGVTFHRGSTMPYRRERMVVTPERVPSVRRAPGSP